MKKKSKLQIKTIYIAASFAFKTSEETAIRKVIIGQAAEILRNRGFHVFVPHEIQIPNAWGMTNNEWGHAVFGLDMGGLEEADAVVVLSWGKQFTNGGCFWECGFAAAKDLPIVMVSVNKEIESLMVVSSARAHLGTIDELKTYDFETFPLDRTADNEVS